jgi:hypothetical protein
LFNLRPERLPNSSIIFIAMVISYFVFRNNVVNGWVSAPFRVFQGIRQGYPASALTFVLAVEIMAIKLRETKHI